MDFSLLLSSIRQTHIQLQDAAAKAVNRSLTVRNWLIGYYLVEYEQKGQDRAQYGAKLLAKVAGELPEANLSVTSLKLCRQFYLLYPQISQTLADLSAALGLPAITAGLPPPSASAESSIGQPLADQLAKPTSLVNPEKLISRLSFSHIALLLTIDDPLKRAFYEVETIKGNWSKRELKRQINSLLFERMGLSKEPEKLARLVQERTTSLSRPADIIKNVYTFEFLGLPAKDLVEESDLEQGLLNHLQQFLLEMGHGFCLEGRQKRILIGDEYFFVDLVFYHRLLKCHVLVELKVEDFTHANAGQLNTYLSYYKAEVMQPDDNPPVGILLVTNKNEALVQYATAGMDNTLFVSKYLVELPSKEKLQKFIMQEVKNI